MTRVGQVDQILLLLREQLQRSEARQSGRAAPPQRRAQLSASPLERARGLAALSGLAPEERRRAVLQALLAERLGERLGNDPGFVRLVDQVLAMISAEPEGLALIDRAVAELGAG